MAIDIIPEQSFDCTALDSETQAFIQEKTQRIHSRLKRTAEDIIAIGQDLIEVKKRLSYGHFVPWLQSEFEMTIRSAQRFMQIAEKFGSRNDNLSFLPVSILYELAAPSTPETIIQMVESGQIPATLSAIREAKHELEQESISAQQFVDEVFPGFCEMEQGRGIPPQFFRESSPSFTQWQEDNVALGLDQFGDVPPEKTPEPEQRDPHNAHIMRVMGSSESPEWYTPQEVIDLVLACFGEIDLDPCSNSHDQPTVPARTLYTRDDDGLSHDWHGKMYLNPPYGSEIPAWIQKLVQEYESGNVEEAIALLPARIDTQWFQPLYAYPMCHVRGRIQFANAQNSAPFPSILVYLGRKPGRFIDTFKELGPIMGRIG